MRMLMIVDPQVDFISGTLPVDGAAEAMDALAAYLLATDRAYAAKVVTADHHPFFHSSFTDKGGEWPRHCVADTVGAAIWPALVDPLYLTSGNVTVVHKGTSADTDEYSVFRNPLGAADVKKIVEQAGITDIDICGIAGDVCVLNTLADAARLFGAEALRVLTRFSPSLDGGAALDSFIARNNLKCDR